MATAAERKRRGDEMELELEKNNKIPPEIRWMKCHDQGRENGEIRGKDREG